MDHWQTLHSATRLGVLDAPYPLRYLSTDDGVDLGRLVHAAGLPLPNEPTPTLSACIDWAFAALQGEYGRLLDACSFVIETRSGLLGAIVVVKQANTVEILQLAVDQAFQQQQFEQALLSTALNGLAQARYPRVQVRVLANSSQAHFFTNHGFMLAEDVNDASTSNHD
ncbi:GNAT family N-acetyltransferase [Herpetosiphon giganteus]|uniref:GNAT family N-acetyltransferase n=1 Tax=Herpetosiphon giganteus TaxID=2029754 RepID=UPI0019566529|nr:GNAT family N-acetyltransferase [Herpetosiphon giganteus]MBM7845886.1 ribosomal protein S18 acetylase RimI-like enzyme [Herpetosiphon giganteus]